MADLLYARMMTRYGITFPGLVLAGGAGVYLGTLPAGYIALIATAFRDPRILGALPVLCLLGAAAGAIVGYATRNKILPKLPHRYRRGAIAGLISMPGFGFLGQLHNLTASESANQWAVGFALCCGAATTVVYYRWRKHLAAQRTAQRAAQAAQRHASAR